MTNDSRAPHSDDSGARSGASDKPHATTYRVLDPTGEHPIVVYPCPLCSRKLRSPLVEAGQSDTCPRCETRFIVPGRSALECYRQARSSGALHEQRTKFGASSGPGSVFTLTESVQTAQRTRRLGSALATFLYVASVLNVVLGAILVIAAMDDHSSLQDLFFTASIMCFVSAIVGWIQGLIINTLGRWGGASLWLLSRIADDLRSIRESD